MRSQAHRTNDARSYVLTSGERVNFSHMAINLGGTPRYVNINLGTEQSTNIKILNQVLRKVYFAHSDVMTILKKP